MDVPYFMQNFGKEYDMYEYSGEQWEYLGPCKECGAGLYEMDGKIKPSCQVEEGHLCWIKEEKDVNNLRSDR